MSWLLLKLHDYRAKYPFRYWLFKQIAIIFTIFVVLIVLLTFTFAL